MSASPTGEPPAAPPAAGVCTPEFRRKYLPPVPLAELLPKRPRPADDELARGMRLVAAALTESRFAGEAWLPADPGQRSMEKPAWLAFAEERGLSRNAAEWAVYRLVELGHVEVVWPEHNRLAPGRNSEQRTEKQAARYRGGRPPTVCDWDLFEDGRILQIRSFPALWGAPAARPIPAAVASFKPGATPPAPGPSPAAGHPGNDVLDALLKRVDAARDNPLFLTAGEIQLLEVWLKHRRAMTLHPSAASLYAMSTVLRAVFPGPRLEERVEAQLTFNRDVAALPAVPFTTPAPRALPAVDTTPDHAGGRSSGQPASAADVPARAAVGPPPADEPAIDPDEPVAPPTLDGLSDRCQRAYRLYLRAVVHFQLTDATDRTVYDALASWVGRGEPVPSFETWTRYLRDARNHLDAQKLKPRPRPHPSEVRSAVPVGSRT